MNDANTITAAIATVVRGSCSKL